ncbi:uncharacterized protein EV420DRAFT_1735980 [Desarmillaria tabescens]|uniref:Chromatin elongation factor spt5 n=1 Tax=Armillaria tabescens TaxID=1929756 RepID=A0AA39JBG1_ARMTA|nr:uncharacterized protein EV420DRAFT_1735980 [Desarmillaria tabescens]KAK0438716.1 hypothetical protein EV420DRAFT_1735980 [Desarmillaria tabescens]
MTSRHGSQWYNYCGFVDLEAFKDNDCVSDEGEEADDIDDFIDDSNDTTQSSIATFSHGSEDPTAEELEDLVSAVMERARKCRRIDTDLNARNTDPVDGPWVVRSRGQLWRVHVKKHTEDHLVSRLRHYNTPEHCLIAAFCLALIPQWVYLDCQYVNPALRSLLSSSFSVVTTNGCPILEQISDGEESSIQTMQQGKPDPQQGDWVVVTRGPYRNDVGCVREIYDWGAEVLVVPCFYAHEHRHVPQKDKRKNSSLSLWDSTRTLDRLGTTRQIRLETSRKRPDSEYDHGLLILECEIHSLVPATTISVSTLALFMQSQHVIILQAESRVPCPMEWHFQVGDVVELPGPPYDRSGVVCSVNTVGVAVDLDNGAGIHQFPFCCLVKRILVGDFIVCLESGRKGIVQAVENFHIAALTKGPDGEIEEFQRPRNLVSRQSQHTQDYSDYVLKPTAAPNASCIGQHIVIAGYGLVLGGKGGLVIDVIIEEGLTMVMVTLDDEPDFPRMFLPGELTIEGQGEQLDIGETSKALEQIKDPIKTTSETPWIGIQVAVFQTGHPLRNKIGTVRDVICGQDSDSGLRLIIVLETYDPAITNKEYTVDYEHVLQVETKLPLRLHQPLMRSQMAFLPRQSFLQSGSEERMARLGQTQPGHFIRYRAATPPSHLDPAWDPRSKTPPLPGQSSSVSGSRFHLGYEHHVNGKAKTLVFHQGGNSSQVECYIRKGKKKIEAVSAELVEAMHPATPRNYECWIVIKGRHTGKYVRSIRYEKGATPKMPTWWTVAVVTPAEGQVDEQTGEELHLESTDLCLEEESESSRETNMLFSQKLREEAPRH